MGRDGKGSDKRLSLLPSTRTVWIPSHPTVSRA